MRAPSLRDSPNLDALFASYLFRARVGHPQAHLHSLHWCALCASRLSCISDIIDIVSYVVNELGHPDHGLAMQKLPAVAKLPDFTVNAVEWAHGALFLPARARLR